MNTVTINGVDYVEATSQPNTEHLPALRIVIGDRGWVFVGRLTEHGDHVRLSDAKVIRRWGTTAGLGELALTGPTDDTVLDETGTVNVYRSAVVAVIDCVESAWSPVY